MYTAAIFICVDKTWYEGQWGTILKDSSGPKAVGGIELEGKGKGVLTFQLWDYMFTEQVRVMKRPAEKVLLGTRFWR